MLSADRPISCPEFKQDIHDYLLNLERGQVVHINFLKDSVIRPQMRSTVVDWLVQVCSLFIF